MELNTPNYRKDYVGETINTVLDGEPISYFINPRPNVFIPPYTDTAIILGNGPTKLYPQIQQLLDVNRKKIAEAYKLVYACNRAIQDDAVYDYYVLKHRNFLARVSEEKLLQSYVPYDIFLDFKARSNLLPFVSHFDSGASAAYLACFDGHKKVFLMGFDGKDVFGYRTVYDGSFPYSDDGDLTFDYNYWQLYLHNVMKIYKDVEFFRIQLDGAESPASWRSLPNFRDVTVREAVLLGDF